MGGSKAAVSGDMAKCQNVDWATEPALTPLVGNGCPLVGTGRSRGMDFSGSGLDRIDDRSEVNRTNGTERIGLLPLAS
jgi:hypothetical protein